jgi:hypothetical protein
VYEISAEVGISYGTCQAILTEDLNMRYISVKSVPFVVIVEPKEHHLSVATISFKRQKQIRTPWKA